MPVLILLLLGVVYFSMLFNLQMVMNGAAREGARAWARMPGNTNPCCDGCISPCDPDIGDNGFKRNVYPVIRKYLDDNGYDSTQVITTLVYTYGDDLTPDAWNAVIDSAQDASKVKLTLVHFFFLPIGGTDLLPVEIRASSTFKIGS